MLAAVEESKEVSSRLFIEVATPPQICHSNEMHI